MKKLTWLVLCFVCLAAKATDVHFDLSKFNANPVAGRTVLLQPLQPMPGNLISNVSDDNGMFTATSLGHGTNPVDYVVSVRALGGASKIDFQITVPSASLGTVEADTITSQLGVQTYPTAGKSSWTIQAADQRYQLSGTTLSNTFYPLFSNPSNYVPITFLQATNLALSNSIYLTSNALQTAISAAGISAATVTNIGSNTVYQATNGYSSIVYSNGAIFVNSNLLYTTSNSLAGQIGSAGISAVTATNISTNQVYLGTNSIGISSGFAAYVSTNRFDVSGAAVSVFTNLPFIIVTNGSVTATIQAQLHSATNGGHFIFQTSLYAITNSLLITNNNIDFDLNGATLSYGIGLTGAMVYATNQNTHVRVHGGKFYGGALATYNSINYYRPFNGVAVPYYNLTWTNRTGLRIDGSGGSEVDHNIFTGWSGNGVFGVQVGGTFSAQSTNQLKIHDNICAYNFAGIYLPGASYEYPGYYNSDSSLWVSTDNAEYAQVYHNSTFGNQMGIVATAGNAEVIGNSCDDFIGLAAFAGSNGQHGSYLDNTFNHSVYGSYFESGNGGLFQGNRYMAAQYIFFSGVTSLQFQGNKIASAALIFTNGCTGWILNNQFDLAGTWGGTTVTNFIGSPALRYGGNVSEGGTNTDGTKLSSLIVSNSFVGDGSNLTNLLVSGLSTNNSSVNYILASIGGTTVWTNATTVLGSTIGTTNPVQVLYTNALPSLTNAFIRLLEATNVSNGAVVSKLNTTNGMAVSLSVTNTLSVTNGNYVNLWLTDGTFLRSNTIFPNDWERHKINGVTDFGTGTVARITFNAGSGFTSVKLLQIPDLATSGARTNMLIVTDSAGTISTNDLTSFVASIISGTAGGNAPITNAYGTNLTTLLFTGQRLYIPTNWDVAGGSNFLFSEIATASNAASGAITTSSNFLYSTKLNETNGTAYGLTSTNTSLEGNTSFGYTGLATNFRSTTNIVGFYNAGTSLATNGSFIWVTTLGCYTNWVNGSILTNNSTAWLLQTNGVSLYSLAGASPFGTYSAVSGTGTPLGFPSWIFDHNGMLDVGPISVTNINSISNSIVTNVVFISSNNAIANMGGNGTNTSLYNSALIWNNPRVNFAGSSGATMDFQDIAAGYYNTNVGGAGYGAGILSGATNRITNHGGSVIAGGVYNAISGFGRNYGAILGGLSNTVTAGDATSIAGGEMNTASSSYFDFIGAGQFNTMTSAQWSSIVSGYYNTNNAVGSSIVGGQSNYVLGNWSLAFGQNIKLTNDNSVIFSDGTPTSTTTNSQFVASYANGIYLNGPLWLNQLSTNGGIYILSNRFSIYAVTNTMPNFAHWIGPSNGLIVDCYYSNGVAVFKTLAP